VLLLDGTVKVWLIEESPLVGDVDPPCAAYVPLWTSAVTTLVAAPEVVQPEKVPVSNPPLVMPLPPPEEVTVRLTVVLWVALVPVPVTVSVYVPAAAVPVLMVSVELLPAVTDVGLKLAVAPEGTPLTLKFTVCAEPLVTVVPMVEVPLLPWAIERVLGLALIEKLLLLAEVTVTVTVVVCETLPSVPVTVTV
jgi:hypothetical protein